MRKANQLKKIGYVMAVAMILMSFSGCSMKEEEASYRDYGILCLQNGDYQEAEESFQMALNQSRGKVGNGELDIAFYKAEAQYRAGKVEDARDTYTAIIAYNQDPRAYYLRGCLYYKNGQMDLGQADFNAALEQDKKNYKLYIGIYEMLNSVGASEEGAALLGRALQIKGDDATDKMNKGYIEFLLGDYEQAVLHLNEAVEKGNREANFYLAQVYTAKGDADTANKFFQAYVDAGLADSFSLCEIGKQQMQQEKYKDAMTYFTKAMELDNVPNQQEIMRHMIIAQEKMGEFAQARQTMETYISMYDTDEEAQREFMFLGTR